MFRQRLSDILDKIAAIPRRAKRLQKWTARLWWIGLIVLVGVFFNETLFRGRVLSGADFLLSLPPWQSDGHKGSVNVLHGSNPHLWDDVVQFYPQWKLIRERLRGLSR